MGRPPQLTPQERSAALEKAALSRRRRAEVKRELKDGELTLSKIFDIATHDEAIAKMRVLELIESIPGVGKVRSIAALDRLKISRTRRIQGLGRHQVKALIEEFEPGHHRPERGTLLVLSGPGGVGKSSVARELRTRGIYWVSISATTRSPREGEIDGVDYFFISESEFDSRVSQGDFLEWAVFAGARYGTPRSAVEKALQEGKSVLLEIEIAGAKQVKKKMPDALLVFLEPPSWEELVARLEGRGTDSPERRAQRLALAQEELAASKDFDRVLVNDQVERVVASLIEFASA